MTQNLNSRFRDSYASEQRRIERRMEKRYHYRRFERPERTAEHRPDAESLKQQHLRWLKKRQSSPHP